MIRPKGCDGCGDPLVLEEGYAVHDGLVEGELQRWRCRGCGDTSEDVVPLDDVARVA